MLVQRKACSHVSFWVVWTLSWTENVNKDVFFKNLCVNWLNNSVRTDKGFFSLAARSKPNSCLRHSKISSPCLRFIIVIYVIIAQEIFSWYASAPWSTTDLRTFKLGIDIWGLQCLSACFTAGTKESKTVVTKKKRFLDLKSKLEFLDYVVAINYVQRQPLSPIL